MRAYDVVVVGAGINGAAAAYHLVSLGVRRVLVVDGGGDSATAASAAVISTHYPWLPETLLATAGLTAFEQMPDEIGVDPWVSRDGVDHLVGARHAGAVRESVRAQVSRGVPIELEDVATASRRWPDVHPGSTALVVHEHRGGCVDPVRVTGGYLAGALRAGADVLRASVERFVIRRGRVVGVATTDGEVAAGSVVLAAGVGAGPVLRRSGLSVPFTPRRVRTATFRAATGPVRAPVLLDLSGGWWMRGDRSGTVTVGLELALPDPTGARVGTLDDTWFHAMCAARVRARLPRAGTLTHVSSRSALVAMSPTGRIVVDRLPELDGAVGVLADCGTALKMAPAIGRAVAEWVFGDRPASHDLTPFALPLAQNVDDGRDGYGRFATTARLLRERATHLCTTPAPERKMHAD